MGTVIAVRDGLFDTRNLRRLATRVTNAAQARLLLAIAAVLHSAAREEAAARQDLVAGWARTGGDG